MPTTKEGTTVSDELRDTIKRALREARKGAADAGYDVDAGTMPGGKVDEAVRQAVRAATGAVEAPTAQRRVEVVPTALELDEDALRLRRRTVRRTQDELGVSMSLGGGQVLINYPVVDRRVVAFRTVDVRSGDADRVINLHCDPVWLREIVDYGQ
jgi:hypothetical protein